MSEPSEIKVRHVACPHCQGQSVYASSNLFRPFCSERCKRGDFGAWASEGFRVAADASPDELEFGDPKLQ